MGTVLSVAARWLRSLSRPAQLHQSETGIPTGPSPSLPTAIINGARKLTFFIPLGGRGQGELGRIKINTLVSILRV